MVERPPMQQDHQRRSEQVRNRQQRRRIHGHSNSRSAAARDERTSSAHSSVSQFSVRVRTHGSSQRVVDDQGHHGSLEANNTSQRRIIRTSAHYQQIQRRSDSTSVE